MFFPLSYKGRVRVRERPRKTQRGEHEILAKSDGAQGRDSL